MTRHVGLDRVGAGARHLAVDVEHRRALDVHGLAALQLEVLADRARPSAPCRRAITSTVSEPPAAMPPAAAITSASCALRLVERIAPGRATMPSTDTWRLLTVVSATVTCGLLRYLPCFSASAICVGGVVGGQAGDLDGCRRAASAIVPFSSTRASSREVGLLEHGDVHRVAGPSLSALCAQARQRPARRAADPITMRIIVASSVRFVLS